MLRRWKLFLELQTAKKADVATMRQRSVKQACSGVLQMWRELFVAEQAEAAAHEAKVRSGLENLSHGAVCDIAFAYHNFTISISQVSSRIFCSL